MKNHYDEDDDYDYSPNELAKIASTHREKYEQIVRANLSHNEDDRSVEQWEQDNLKWAQQCLAEQRANRRS